MPSDFAQGALRIVDAHGGLVGGAALDAQTAPGALLRPDFRHEDGVLAQFPRMRTQHDRFAAQGTVAEAHFAAKPLPGKAGVRVDHRDAHAGVADRLEFGRKRSRRTGLHAGEILAHVAGDLFGLEVGRPHGRGIADPGDSQRLVGARRDALSAVRAGGKEVLPEERPRRTRHPAGVRVAHRHRAPAEAEHDAGGTRFGGPGEKASAIDFRVVSHVRPSSRGPRSSCSRAQARSGRSRRCRRRSS